MARVNSTGSSSSRPGNGIDALDSQARNGAPTPTDTTEWNSFLQANPMLGRSVSISAMQSPSLMPARPDTAGFQPTPVPAMPSTGVPPSFDTSVPHMARSASRAGSRPASRPASRQSSMPPSMLPAKAGLPLLAPKPPASAYASGSPPSFPMTSEEHVAVSTPPPEVVQPASARPSRPASRSRSRVPTGRPRGRPRKRQVMDGDTSAAEEAPTDADGENDDGHKKKRVMTVKADYPVRTSLDAGPDSLRVAASTSGSLRTLRPVMSTSGPSGDGAAGLGSHLQEFPRAPTPVPQGRGGPPSQHHARKIMAQRARRESLADFDSSTFADHSFSRSLDGRSPTESVAQSPENYTPEDSPADIGSSPPVPRTASYVPPSSPMPSSPPLPPMRRPQPDSGFMSGGVDDLFDDDDCLHDKSLPPPTPHDATAPTPTPAFSQPLPQDESAPGPARDAPARSAAPSKETARPSKAANQPGSRRNSTRPPDQFCFMAINPGPPELLPTTVLYNPPLQPKPRVGKTQRSQSMASKPPPPSLERSHSEPAQIDQPDGQPANTAHNQAHMQQQQQEDRHTFHLTPFPLPSDADNAMDSSEMQSTHADLFMSSSLMSINMPDDLTELAKFLEVSTDSVQKGLGGESQADTSATSVSLSNSSSVSLRSTDSPQLQPALPQQPSTASATSIRPLPTKTATVPASDPPALPPLTLPAAPPPATAFSEAPCPPSDVEVPHGRANKNRVRRAAIRERLQKAIESGEMPPFCQNCGAIETPTWRKMWTQDHEGEASFYEFSEKPGQVTAVDILERDEEGKSMRYRLVKKALGPTEDTKAWTEMLLCNRTFLPTYRGKTQLQSNPYSVRYLAWQVQEPPPV